MKKLGYIIFATGFIAASLTTVTDVLNINWTYFVATLVITIIGIIMIRSEGKKELSNEETINENMSLIKLSLEKIVKEIIRIGAEINPENPQEVHTKIDEKLPAHIEAFVDSRKTIGHIHGLSNYANIMNHFAAAERYLNRVWSASTDGYIDEITMYIKKSEEEFVLALQKLNSLKVTTR